MGNRQTVKGMAKIIRIIKNIIELKELDRLFFSSRFRRCADFLLGAEICPGTYIPTSTMASLNDAVSMPQ